jgi:murein DD-endopeptidase MepM/ murein hydrolase activator NlpD
MRPCECARLDATNPVIKLTAFAILYHPYTKETIYTGVTRLRLKRRSSLGIRANTVSYPGRFSPARSGFRKRTRTLVIPRVPLLIASAVVLTVAVVLGALAFGQPALTKAQEVYFDGRMLCVAQNQSDAVTALQQLKDELKQTYHMDIQCAELTFTPVSCSKQNLCSAETIKAALKSNLDVKVLASVITVNDRPAVALRTASEAQQVLDSVLAPFKDAPSQLNRTDVGFVETVKIQQVPTDYSLVQEPDEAKHTLTLGANVKDNLYAVKKGDSLAKIAKKFQLKVSDLRKANPEVASLDVLQPGQSLNAIKPANWVTIRYTETVTRREVLPFETVEQPSATLYTTQKEIQQKGKAGQRDVVAKITYINGMEAQKEILSQTVISAAQQQIVLKGTKKVPVNSGSTTTGSTSGTKLFVLPLKQYRITSTFSVRTLQGVTKWHYGLDLAAPLGTPIYAARSGTVSYAGSATGYGLLIMIDHGGGVQSRYGHCSKLLVKKGQTVKQGQLIGLVGSTGHSTGPHCHFEIRINGKPVDPKKYIK